MRTVHVRICHDDDFVVADLLDVEGTFLVAITNTGTNGGDHGLDLLVLKHLVEAGFLHVDQFTADRENRLGASITTLLGRATRGITLNNVEFGFRRIAGRAVSQLAGKTTARHGGLTNCFASLACCLAGAGCISDLLDHLLGETGVFFEEFGDALIDDGTDHTFDFVVD